MAYEGYRSPPPAGQPGYFEYSDPRLPYPAGYPSAIPNEPRISRSRASSSVRGDGYSDHGRYAPPQPPPQYPTQAQPINEAVSGAFDKADTANSIPPDLVAQITADVIKRLQTAGLDNSAPSAPHHPPPPPLARSNSNTSNSPTMPTRNVYTPPSPKQRQESTGYGSPPLHTASQTSGPGPSTHSPPDSPPPRLNEYGMSSPDSIDSGYTRPKVSRLSTGKEQTPLEKFWGTLFDEDGHPTVRLGQFLRGLANHIVKDFEPVESIVVTPSKMAKYYEAVKLPNEIYPWHSVFREKSNTSLSRLYSQLECQHHLVQKASHESPTIPGLTPLGFERWMTTIIQAHPEEEFVRLQKTVLEMPISNADDTKERFPKEISRRLFPNIADQRVKEKFERAITHENDLPPPKHANNDLPPSHHYHPHPRSESNASAVPPPPQSRAESNVSAVPPPPLPTNLERERKPYSNTPADSAVDDGLAQPIERERKPYSSQPGGGKNYEESLKPSARPTRANSTSKARPVNINPINRPGEIPILEGYPQRTSSTVNSSAAPRRRRSPSSSFSVGGDFRRSDNDLLGYQPSASLPRDIEEENRRYARDAEVKRSEWQRRSAEEDPRMFESPRDRERYDRTTEQQSAGPRRGYEEDYYRPPGRGSTGSGGGYDYSQQYPPSYR